MVECGNSIEVTVSDSFSPRLEILPPPQRRLCDEFMQVPPEFVRCGGTAIALYLGHRESADFDFFGNRSLDSNNLTLDIPFLADATVTQREPNTLTCVVDRGGPAGSAIIVRIEPGSWRFPQPDGNAVCVLGQVEADGAL